MLRIVLMCLRMLALARRRDGSRLGAAARGRARRADTPRHVAGSGDPANFDVEECSTQRNLSERGRQQADRTGRAVSARGAKPNACCPAAIAAASTRPGYAFDDREPEVSQRSTRCPPIPPPARHSRTRSSQDEILFRLRQSLHGHAQGSHPGPDRRLGARGRGSDRQARRATSFACWANPLQLNDRR